MLKPDRCRLWATPIYTKLMLNFLAIVARRFPILAPYTPRHHTGDRQTREPQSPSLPTHVDTLAAIDIHQLRSCGIQGAILDLDNTIVSEDDQFVSPHAEAWIAKAKDLGLQFFILSNGKRRYRVEYWSHSLEVPALSPAKKPFPGAFRKALNHMQLASDQVVVIGDSRHTDVFGAWLIGSHCIQVSSLPHPPRWWEKLVGKYVQIPYPIGHELWEFKPAKHYGKA